ncbi:hypothetical protein DH2020_022265 [Rehmannia glutinosa]|uniref:Reverse transcriptase domain-containing protein n=1 Tax=Rehmannia glutinosa TaxID=99300 RepID=A0ABR0WE69_REHGL
MTDVLTQPFTGDEVTRALKHMHPLKSPGHDVKTHKTPLKKIIAQHLQLSLILVRFTDLTTYSPNSDNQDGPEHFTSLFNDDTLIFGHATTQEAINLKFAIDLYSAASGQCINFEKSGILFSSNMNPSTRSSISRIWQIPKVNSHRMYLGLPSVIEANKKQIFSAILDKCWAKFHGWKEKNPSQAGRITIIQSVIHPSPPLLCLALNSQMLPSTKLNH